MIVDFSYGLGSPKSSLSASSIDIPLSVDHRNFLTAFNSAGGRSGSVDHKRVQH